MTRQEYLKFHKEMCDKLLEVAKQKNADYSGAADNDDPFANFRIVEKIGICSAEIGFLTRMSDKLARLSTYAKKGQLAVKSESVLDTCEDLANYSILLAGYLYEKALNLEANNGNQSN